MWRSRMFLSPYTSGHKADTVMVSDNGVLHAVHIFESYELPRAILLLDLEDRDLMENRIKILVDLAPRLSEAPRSPQLPSVQAALQGSPLEGTATCVYLFFNTSELYAREELRAHRWQHYHCRYRTLPLQKSCYSQALKARRPAKPKTLLSSVS